MGGGQFPLITTGADTEPMLEVKIENKQTAMLVDTGATHTCVSPECTTHLPLSGKCVKTVGFSGTKQLIPMTVPARITTESSEIKIPILVSEQTPINLLGRDALCKLKIKIWCSPLGVYIDNAGLMPQMYSRADGAKVYWLGDITEPVTTTFQKWEKYI